MAIVLNWVSRNAGEDGTKIYRSESPIDPADLPEPIAVVDPGVTTYEDSDVESLKTYYYRFGVFRGDDLALSEEHVVKNIYYSGPGPQELVTGDFENGYFGELPSSQFFTGTELARLVGLTAGTGLNPGTSWHKVANDGKILYIPRRTIRERVSWEDLYRVGCVYGTDDFGKYQLDPPVNQLKIVSRNGQNFKVRLMSGLNPTRTDFPGAGYTLDQETESEWSRIYLRFLWETPPSQLGENYSEYVRADIRFGLTSTNELYILLADHEDGGNRSLLVGGNASQWPRHVGGAGVTGAGRYWVPVLEYLP